MKVCPTCDQTFNDDNLMYCLMDGSKLEPGEGMATVVVPKVVTQPTASSAFPPDSYAPPQPPPKSKTPLIVALTVVVTVILISAVAGILWLFLSNRGDAANGNKPVNVNVTVNKPSPTPKPSASPTPAPSPTVASTKPTPKTEESDEVTPITWSTSASGFKNDVGTTYKFQCPENGAESAIWGSDIYTDDSSICTAGVHAGIISLEKGGIVTIEFRPGRQLYGSTTRNGITSNTFGERGHSYVVR